MKAVPHPASEAAFATYERFGVAFCEAPGPCPVRRSSNDDLGRGIVGVIDELAPAGAEADADVADRKKLLRTIGGKL